KMPSRRTWIWFVVLLVANFLVMRALLPEADAPIVVPYTVFKEQAEKGNVQLIHSRGDTVAGKFATAVTYPPAGAAQSEPPKPGERREKPRTSTSFTTTLPTFV